MLQVDRPFDRWFDLADPYDDVVPTPKRREDTPREWTYAPNRRERSPDPKPQPGR